MSKRIEYIKGQMIKECIFLEDTKPLNNDRAANFKCRCGNVFNTRINSVKNGSTTSCGCVHTQVIRNRNLSHGQSIGNETPEYRSWGAMKSRCNNVDNHAYNDYGGRGIFVCEIWNNSFEKFFEDMGKRPTLKHTLERRDNNKGYSKENCYWATKKEQSNNMRSNVLITYNGKTQPLKLWCEELGLKYKQTWKRIHTFKWSIPDAFEIPCNTIKRLITYKGKTQRVIEWARELGISEAKIRGRLGALGLSAEEALDAKSRVGNNQFSKKKSA